MVSLSRPWFLLLSRECNIYSWGRRAVSFLSPGDGGLSRAPNSRILHPMLKLDGPITSDVET